jgi:hypothetical protein
VHYDISKRWDNKGFNGDIEEHPENDPIEAECVVRLPYFSCYATYRLRFRDSPKLFLDIILGDWKMRFASRSLC